MTNLDVLGYLDIIPVCAAYELNGERIDHFPVSAQLQHAKPVLEKLTGWKSDISMIRHFTELPQSAQDYVHYIELRLDVNIRYISVGPKREQMIAR